MDVFRGTHVLQLAEVTGADIDAYASRGQRMGRVRVCVRGREGARERKGKREREQEGADQSVAARQRVLEWGNRPLPLLVTKFSSSAEEENFVLQTTNPGPHTTRWSTPLSSKVYVHHKIDCAALCGAKLVSQYPRVGTQRNLRTSPSDMHPGRNQGRSRQSGSEGGSGCTLRSLSHAWLPCWEVSRPLATSREWQLCWQE